MDIPLEKAIKRTKMLLEQLMRKDPKVAFHCPVCGGYFENLMNYRELGMCGGCYVKTKTAELKRHVEQVIGATIVDVKVEPADPMYPTADKPAIIEITIKTKDGKTITLKKPPEVHYIL